MLDKSIVLKAKVLIDFQEKCYFNFNHLDQNNFNIMTEGLSTRVGKPLGDYTENEIEEIVTIYLSILSMLVKLDHQDYIGADIFDKNESVLYLAAQRDLPTLALDLIGLGADVNAKSEDNGTPLLKAAHHNNIDLLNALIAKGADPTVADTRGYTPLNTACLFGHFEIIQALTNYHHNLITNDNEAYYCYVFLLYTQKYKPDLRAIKLLLDYYPEVMSAFINKQDDKKPFEEAFHSSIKIGNQQAVAKLLTYNKLLVGQGQRELIDKFDALDLNDMSEDFKRKLSI